VSIVFVLSTGRTGSQAIARYFDDLAPEVRAVHEPFPSRLLRIAGNAYRRGHLSSEQMIRLLRLSRGRRIYSCQYPTYLEASPYLRSCVELLPIAFPGTRIVHIVRHPGTYIPSYINHGVFSGFKGFIGHSVPYWLLKPEHVERFPVKRWRDMGAVERIAWRWDTLNRMIEDASGNFGEGYIRFRFEHLFDAESSGMRRLAEWVGTSASAAVQQAAGEAAHNESRLRVFPTEGAWRDSAQDAIEHYCGERMTRYGYTTDRTN